MKELAYVIFDTTSGVIFQSMRSTFPMAEAALQPGQGLWEGELPDLDSYYFKDWVPIAKTVMPVTRTDGDGILQLTVPPGSTIYWPDGGSDLAEGGEIQWESDNPGDHFFVVDHPQYFRYEGTFNVAENG